ncbi:MAG: NGG1p interacting factor NIF3 [Candidatus Aminicenantales bacterium]|jgi:putative NIF3 family GTP cyclohydrolase 1 type 2
MKLESLYRKAVAVGMSRDLREPDEIRRILDDEDAKFRKLSTEEAKTYDLDRLFNPFADTRILAGAPETEVGRVIVGIDMETSEVLLTHVLNRDLGRKIDLIIAHHPEGHALARLHDVMKLQSDLLAACGVNVSVAEQLLDKRMGEIERRLLPVNHNRAVDAAFLLGIPMMCVHTPADNCVTSHLRDVFEREKPAKLKDLLDLLRRIPEYRKAERLSAGPKIVSGSDASRCGRIFVDMTGGTEGPKTIFEQHAISGVSTIVAMHVSEEALENAKKANLNVVIAGHVSSDTLGLNLLFDEVEADGRLDFVNASGFERIRKADR